MDEFKQEDKNKGAHTQKSQPETVKLSIYSSSRVRSGDTRYENTKINEKGSADFECDWDQGQGKHLTKSDQIKWLCQLFQKVSKIRESDELWSRAGVAHQNAVMQLDSALRWLVPFLEIRTDQKITELITTAYFQLNRTNLKLASEDQERLQFVHSLSGAHCNLTTKDREQLQFAHLYGDWESGFKGVSNISSEICRLALMEDKHSLPAGIRRMLWWITRWGVEEAKRKVQMHEPIDVNENVTVGASAFQDVFAEYRRLEQSRTWELMLLDRKHGASKQQRHETETQQYELSQMKSSTRAGGLASCLSTFKRKEQPQMQLLSDYRKTSAQIQQGEIWAFYDERLGRLKQKFDDLVEKQGRSFEADEYGGMNDRMLFAGCVYGIIEPQVWYYMGILRRLATEDMGRESRVADLGSSPDNKGNVRSYLRSISQMALAVVS
ncbi:MAG: hypothetical protein LBJ38_03270 [Oscillospiraceae bacterium]|nr:hypothetical protein [Oscillospiraceae bacterium]